MIAGMEVNISFKIVLLNKNYGTLIRQISMYVPNVFICIWDKTYCF